MAAKHGRVEELEEELQNARLQVESMKKELDEVKERARDLKRRLEDEEDRLVLANSTIKKLEKQNEIAKRVRAASLREHTEGGLRMMRERDQLELRLKQQEEEVAQTVRGLEMPSAET
jgi:chromosome segregation ATPase